MFQGFRARGGVSFSPSTGTSTPAARPRLRVRVGFRGGVRIFGIEGINTGGTSLLTRSVTGRG